MTVKLTYFKPSGNYYWDDEYQTNKEDMFEIASEVRTLRDIGHLPGLVQGHSKFIVLIDVPEHPHNHPILIV
jgi:hypothetical protein